MRCLSLADRTNKKRFGNAAFWGLVALSLIAGHRIGDSANGWLVIALSVLGGFNLLGRGEAETGEVERTRSASASATSCSCRS